MGAAAHRMHDHIRGRRHCLAVAESHLARPLKVDERRQRPGRGAARAELQPNSEAQHQNSVEIPSETIVADIFHRLSTAPLERSAVDAEPPDLALAAVLR